MPGRPWTKSQIEVLRHMHDEGKNAIEIGQALNRTPTAIRTLRGMLGLRFYVQIDPAEREQIYELHAAGVSDVEIAETTGRAVTTVRKMLGLQKAIKRKWSTAETRRLYALRRQGLTYPQIGELLNRTPHACVMRYVNWEEAKRKRAAKLRQQRRERSR